MVGGVLSDKRGLLLSAINPVIASSITGAGSVIVVQYLPQDVGAKPVVGRVWDTLEYEPNLSLPNNQFTHYACTIWRRCSCLMKFFWETSTPFSHDLMFF